MVQKFVLLTMTPRMTEITNVDNKKKERLSAKDSNIILLPLVDSVIKNAGPSLCLNYSVLAENCKINFTD